MPHPYGLEEADEKVRTEAEAIARDVAGPHAAQVDAEGRFPAETIAALGSSGLLGLCVGRENGGRGLGPRAFAAATEEIAERCSSSAMVFVMHVTGQQAISASSTLAGQAALLGEIAAGRHLTTLAFSEKGSRSQFWAPVSELIERPGGGFVVNASKSWVTSANQAHSFVASARRPGAASPLESTLFLLRRGSPGARVPSRWDGLGLRGNDSAPLVLENTPVAAGDLLTAQGQGADGMLQVVLPWFSVGTAAMANGICRAAVTATATHLQQTGFQHTGSSLRDLPNLRARLAEMAVRTAQARATLGHTLAQLAHPTPETALHVLMTRLASLQASVDVTDLAMKTCGGAAFSRQGGIERLFRDARAGWVMAPTVDHLHDFIGRALTGLPLF
jgi:alkylation response protein AidB-like acyl-CoA dehydrogenase